MLKAHATAYHMYHDEYRPTQKGQIGIDTNCMGWVSGKHTTDESIKQFFQFDCGWIMHPIYIGDYPQIMKTRIASISKLEGHSFSRLPEFSEKWIKYIKFVLSSLIIDSKLFCNQYLKNFYTAKNKFILNVQSDQD